MSDGVTSDLPPFQLKRGSWVRCDGCGGWMVNGESGYCSDCTGRLRLTIHLTGNSHPTTPLSEVNYHGTYPEDEDVDALLRDWWKGGELDLDEMWRRRDEWREATG